MDLDHLNPEFHRRLNAFLAAAEARGIPAHIISGYRDNAEQAALYDRYQHGGPLAAPPGRSYHNYGFAGDVLANDPSRQDDLIALANDNPSYGIHALGPVDRPHFQMAGNLDQLRAQYGGDSGPARYTVDQIFNAILGQESGGKDLTSAKGAHGPMQIMPATFAENALPGESITSYDDNLKVGRRIIQKYYDMYGGDPGRIAVAYFSGPGNVAGMAFKDPYKEDKNDGGINTSAYVQQVMGRLGQPGSGAAGTGAGAQQNPPQPPVNPYASLASSLSSAVEGIGNSMSVGVGGPRDPPDQPAIRAPALSADFMAPTPNPVPQTLASGIGAQLGNLAIQSQSEQIVDPSITQGAPSMTAMLGQVGTSYDPTSIDPRRTGAINPYMRTPRLA